MNALELADWLIAFTEDNADYEEQWIKEVARMLREKEAEIEQLQKQIEVQGKLLRAYAEKLEEYKAVLTNIANDYPELSHDKARMQNLDHIKWAKEVLK